MRAQPLARFAFSAGVGKDDIVANALRQQQLALVHGGGAVSGGIGIPMPLQSIGIHDQSLHE
jgi:hypothetical protein